MISINSPTEPFALPPRSLGAQRTGGGGQLSRLCGGSLSPPRTRYDAERASRRLTFVFGRPPAYRAADNRPRLRSFPYFCEARSRRDRGHEEFDLLALIASRRRLTIARRYIRDRGSLRSKALFPRFSTLFSSLPRKIFRHVTRVSLPSQSQTRYFIYRRLKKKTDRLSK